MLLLIFQIFAIIYADALEELKERFEKDTEEYEIISEALAELESYAVSQTGQDYGIDFYEYNEIIHGFSKAKISTGSKAIEYLLENIDSKSWGWIYWRWNWKNQSTLWQQSYCINKSTRKI